MNKDYQISEMAASGYSKLMWDLWSKCGISMEKCERAEQRLKELDYRKQSDTAKEILAEIKNKIDNEFNNNLKIYSSLVSENDYDYSILYERINGEIDVLCSINNFIDELMYKYT